MRGHVFVDNKTRYYGLVTTPANNEYRREEVIHGLYYTCIMYSAISWLCCRNRRIIRLLRVTSISLLRILYTLKKGILFEKKSKITFLSEFLPILNEIAKNFNSTAYSCTARSSNRQSARGSLEEVASLTKTNLGGVLAREKITG